MGPTPVCCPTGKCPARGHTGPGNLGIDSRQDKRCLCTQCHTTCTATQGTVFSRLRPSLAVVTMVGTVLAYGGPLPALVAALGCAERTVAAWRARAGRRGPAVQESLVEPPRALGQGPADERRVQQPGGSGWLALALMVKTRWWRAGAVREPRDPLAEAAPQRAGAPLRRPPRALVLYRWGVLLRPGEA